MQERGAGIIAHPEMLTYLEEQGIADWDELATHTNRTHHLDGAGKPVDVEGRATYTTSWDTVYRKLRDDLPDGTYRMGKETTGVEQHDDGVTVSFADGDQVEADLLVVGEGYRSSTREQFAPDRTRRSTRATSPTADASRVRGPPEYPSLFSDVYNLYHAPRSQFLTYPVPGPNGEMERGSAASTGSGTTPSRRARLSTTCSTTTAASSARTHCRRG